MNGSNVYNIEIDATSTHGTFPTHPSQYLITIFSVKLT